MLKLLGIELMWGSHNQKFAFVARLLSCHQGDGLSTDVAAQTLSRQLSHISHPHPLSHCNHDMTIHTIRRAKFIRAASPDIFTARFTVKLGWFPAIDIERP